MRFPHEVTVRSPVYSFRCERSFFKLSKPQNFDLIVSTIGGYWARWLARLFSPRCRKRLPRRRRWTLVGAERAFASEIIQRKDRGTWPHWKGDFFSFPSNAKLVLRNVGHSAGVFYFFVCLGCFFFFLRFVLAYFQCEKVFGVWLKSL